MEKEQKRTPSFAAFYAKESPIPFYVLLGLFAISNMLRVVNFAPGLIDRVTSARLAINTLLLWLCPMYFALNLILWRMKPATVAAGIASIAGVFLLWNFIGQYIEVYCTMVAAFLALLAYKRDYRMVLKIFLFAHLATIIIAAVGLKLGYTLPRYKVFTKDFGVSLGLIYPNHLGRMVYIVMTIAWYLWGQKKRLLTTAAFWGMAAVMWYYVKCKTIAAFMIVFPVCWLATEGLTRVGHEGGARAAVRRVWQGLMIAMPLICLAITYVGGLEKETLDKMYTYGTAEYSLAMRFISAGIFFQIYGFPLLGTNIVDINSPIVFMNGHVYVANIVDNAYIHYLICLGGICFVACLLWLCLANWEMIKNGDHALLLMAVFMLGYGLIEIVTFQFEHNFIWFYPLTASALSAVRNGRGERG